MTNVLDSTIVQISRICVAIGLSQASYSAAQIGGSRAVAAASDYDAA